MRKAWTKANVGGERGAGRGQGGGGVEGVKDSPGLPVKSLNGNRHRQPEEGFGAEESLWRGGVGGFLIWFGAYFCEGASMKRIRATIIEPLSVCWAL